MKKLLSSSIAAIGVVATIGILFGISLDDTQNNVQNVLELTTPFPFVFADHQFDYSDILPDYEYENFIVFQTLGGEYQVMKSYLEMDYPTMQTDNERLIVDSQVYLSDGTEWSVGAGIRHQLYGDDEPYVNYFVYYSECYQCGSDFIIYGAYPESGEQTQPRVEVTTENPIDEICFILNPDASYITQNLEYSNCMNPYEGISGSVDGVAYSGIATSKSFTGNCEACRNSMNAEFYDMATSTFRNPDSGIDWNYWLTEESRVFKCFYSKGHIHDFDVDENTISTGVYGDTTVESYMCDKDSNNYSSILGPKGWVWSNIAGDWSIEQ